MWRPRSLLTWNFETRTSQVVGDSAPSSSWMNVDLPEPDGPIRKTNSPLSILTLMSSKAGRADDLYCLLTWSRVIITARQFSGASRWQAKFSWPTAPTSALGPAPARVRPGSCSAGRRAAAAGTVAAGGGKGGGGWGWGGAGAASPWGG